MYAVLDTETTGFSKQDRVIEVGVAICDPAGNTTGSWGTLIDPGRGVSPGVTEIHGITRRMLDGAPTFEEVAAFLCQVLRGRLFVAHNAPFDARMLTQEFTRLGMSVPLGKGQYVCTMQRAKQLWPEAGSHKLGDLCPTFGIDLTDAHEALNDAQATAKLLRVMLLNGLDLADLTTTASAAEWPRPVQLPMVPQRRHQALVGNSFAEAAPAA